LDALAAGFAKVLLIKQNLVPSASYKLFTSYDPEAVLWLGFTSKVPAVQERYNLFLKIWPEARQRVPYVLMQEMRITPELPGYAELVHAIFLELIDGRLTTPEEMRAYLEPHSPPAPPPQVSIKKPRARRGAEAKLKEQAYDEDEESEETIAGDDDLDDMGGDEDEIDIGLPKGGMEPELDDEEEGEDEEESEPAATKSSSKRDESKPSVTQKRPLVVAEKSSAAKTVATPARPGKTVPVAQPKPAEAKLAANGVKPAPAGKVAKPVAVKAAPQLEKPKHAVPAVKSSGSKVAAKAPVKPAAKPPVKVPAKAPVKTAAKVHGKTAPAKSAHTAVIKPGKPLLRPVKPAEKKKSAAKPAKKR
jgi:tRNA nucleotidyltransferase (CCA-adding enzyme)